MMKIKICALIVAPGKIDHYRMLCWMKQWNLPLKP